MFTALVFIVLLGVPGLDRRRAVQVPAVRPRSRRDPQGGRVRDPRGVFIARLRRDRERHRRDRRRPREHDPRVRRRGRDRDRVPAGARTRPAPRGPPRVRQARDAVRGAVRVLGRGGRRRTRPRTSCRGWRRSSARGPVPSAARSGCGSASELRPAASWPGERRGRDPSRCEDGRPGRFGEGEDGVEVRHLGELLGALSVTMPPSDPMNPSKERLVRDLASQAGLVLRNVRLIEELRASRQRLVAAQDESAKQLERNLHDGAQQQLVALGSSCASRGGSPSATPPRGRRCSTRCRARRDRRAREPARPRARDLPAAARRPGSARRARGAGAQGGAPRRGRGRRRRPLPAGGRGGRLLLLPRGAEERREVRGGVGARVRLADERRDAHVRGRRRRARGSTRRTATGPGCRAWRTGSRRSAARSRSERARGGDDGDRPRPGGDG